MHTLAAELGPRGIRVNSVSPGSAEASYVNGQDLVVDGGLVAAIPPQQDSALSTA